MIRLGMYQLISDPVQAFHEAAYWQNTLEAHFSLSKYLARTSFKTLVRDGHRPTCLDHCAKTFEALYSQTYDFFLLSKITKMKS